MEGPTQFIEIPGYAEALRRESELRRKAWSDDTDTIAGVKVRLLTLRDMEKLAAMRNGFFCPWRFETESEFLGHCAQLVWWLAEDCPKYKQGAGFVSRVIASTRAQMLINHLGAQPQRLAEDVSRYLKDTFMDAPKGSTQSVASPIAGGPAYLCDLLASGGYSLGVDDVLDMPLVRLWQLARLVMKRNGDAPTNESDRIATEYVASLNKK